MWLQLRKRVSNKRRAGLKCRIEGCIQQNHPSSPCHGYLLTSLGYVDNERLYALRVAGDNKFGPKNESQETH
jgi:hypothetical protein